MNKTAIIGSGFIGRAWAISFARAGYQVSLWDQDGRAPAAAHAYIADVLGDLDRNDLLNGQTPATVLGRIHPDTVLESALKDVVHVQENTPENLEVKIDVFKALDEVAPADAVIASSTSAILPSKFTEALKG
ncbi:MAG: NAD-dependent epimerase/dehydratase family protein, partial [Alphaproteobacteria bacterium]|nr:NAD-dependent epimerase/dehydratase family protein [Alphaproteobacteria bacterium]